MGGLKAHHGAVQGCDGVDAIKAHMQVADKLQHFD